MSIESRKATEDDLKTIENQLGRTPRDVHAISYRCPCGKAAVVETPPRLSNGEPFPTFYYATCPRLTAAISTLETTGMMEEMTSRLETDAELAGAYAAAHDDYIAARSALKIDVPEVGTDDFRRSLAAFIGNLAHSGKEFKWDSNPQLKKALEAKLFEDTKDHIKLSALSVKGTTVVDKEVQEKIDAVKKRLIDSYGYNEQSATDVLDYVGSIFARGDMADDEE